MPSVGMRKSTRVLVVKGGNGGGYLRSGRPMWRNSGESRLQKASVDGKEWFNIIKKSSTDNGVYSFKENGISNADSTAANTVVVNGEVTPEIVNFDQVYTSVETRMQGVVFTRKRRRIAAEEVTSCSSPTYSARREEEFPERRMFGKFFVRRKRRKTGKDTSVMVNCDIRTSGYGRRRSPPLAASAEPLVLKTQQFVRLLISIIRHSTMAEIRLRDLSAFLMSSPIRDVLSSHGIHFSLGSPNPETRTCLFFRLCYFLPLFTLDFSATPSCLLYMQINMLLRSRFLPSISTLSVDEETSSNSDSDENMPCVVSYPEQTPTSSYSTPLKCRNMSYSRVTFKLSSQQNDLKSVSKSRTLRTRRRSKRATRYNKKSAIHKKNQHSVSGISNVKEGNAVTCQESVKLPPRRSSTSARSLKSALAGARDDIDSTCCSANILISESDRCYRQDGAEVMLEFSDLKSWVLAVRMKGLLRLSHIPQMCMRPCFSNRFNHAVIWSGGDGWKLEFPDKSDWMVFKEIYKECGARNMQASMARLIPVPQVRQVQTFQGLNGATFSRPSSYIVSNRDEISRAMVRGPAAANYDIESDDEEWLKKFNAENSDQEPVSVDTFEWMIDTFEKAVFCNPCGFSDEQSSVGICMEGTKKGVAEAVRMFWSNKRKQRQSPLVKVFQNQDHEQQQQRKCHKPNPKPVSERRRLLKRPTSNPKRVKQRNVIQAVMAAAERDARRERLALMEAEEAKAREKRMVEVAVEKRLRAQKEMEKADRAIYRATMAVRMAEEVTLFGTTPHHLSAVDVD